jgi:hypothetical protein
MKYQFAFLPGDGIGPAALAEARRVMELVGRLFDRSFNILRFSATEEVIFENCRLGSDPLLGNVGEGLVRETMRLLRSTSSECRRSKTKLQLARVTRNAAARPKFVGERRRPEIEYRRRI